MTKAQKDGLTRFVYEMRHEELAEWVLELALDRGEARKQLRTMAREEAERLERIG